jgi:capsular polysaccharide biosynthesis protein
MESAYVLPLSDITDIFCSESMKLGYIYLIANGKKYELTNESNLSEAQVCVNFLKELIIYLLLGAVLSVGIVFVIFYFDTTIKSAEEVENKLGLPVLGIVPKAKSK